MSISLIGIITVQVFWIKNTIQITEQQFTSNVRFALAKVSEDIRQREFDEFYEKSKNIIVFIYASDFSISNKTILYLKRKNVLIISFCS